MSDTHIGCTQLGRIQRFNDFLNALDEAVSKIISRSPDFVIHAGDFFDRVTDLAPQAEVRAVRSLMRLKAAGIPVYTIVGNHDMGPGRYGPETKLDALEAAGLVKVLRGPVYIEEHDTEIAGINYLNERVPENRDIILGARPKTGARRKILVIHQAIGGLLDFPTPDVYIDISEIPQLGYDLVIGGHIHSPALRRVGNTTVLVPGSTERWSLDERGDKGIWFVDWRNGLPEAQFVRLESVRPVVHLKIQCDGLTRERIEEAVRASLRDNVAGGAIVRVVLEGRPAAADTSIDTAALERYGESLGALDAKIINALQIHTPAAGTKDPEKMGADLRAFLAECLEELGQKGDVAKRRSGIMADIIEALAVKKEKPERLLETLLSRLGGVAK